MEAAIAVLLAALAAGYSPLADPPAPRPKAILVIRHAEKPAGGTDAGLSPEGRARAAAIPDLFARTAQRPDPFPTPDFVFAAKRSKRSNRAVETVAPLAKALNLEIDAVYADQEYAKLAADLLSNAKYDGKTVLVCWHHGTIADFAAALGVDPKPKEWGDAAFDRVWVVMFDDKGAASPLVKRPQALTPRDVRMSGAGPR